MQSCCEKHSRVSLSLAPAPLPLRRDLRFCLHYKFRPARLRRIRNSVHRRVGTSCLGNSLVRRLCLSSSRRPGAEAEQQPAARYERQHRTYPQHSTSTHCTCCSARHRIARLHSVLSRTVIPKRSFIAEYGADGQHKHAFCLSPREVLRLRRCSSPSSSKSPPGSMCVCERRTWHGMAWQGGGTHGSPSWTTLHD